MEYRERLIPDSILREICKEWLSSGLSISKEVLGKIFKRPMRAITFLPEIVDLNNIGVYEDGAIGLSHLIAKQWLIKKLRTILLKENYFTMILEDRICNPGDFSKEEMSHILTINQEVYHVIYPDELKDQNKIMNTLLFAETAIGLMTGFISYLPIDEEILAERLSQKALKAFADQVVLITFEGFDGEGYLILSFD